ncbi:helix-turn-helix domain-containing protein [Paenibacillus alba]|uniref:helix-turn-helix transcriptional regulator n=1 Tax=Paenibacillus alba TaxID=1197127 RepID=UPI0015672F82|nr:helix-turn-helix transcriptional regulator [Paenibacillus alba]NQX65206.1 helix-turn-helix domain-containing protein [Paenibacillus alba]
MFKDNNKSKTLGAFLKSRRNRLQPEQAGFNRSYGQRRTPGLRREEVATLAGVSATYYTWLEQGREITASKDIIENIAKALQLTPDERKHLLHLWNPNETTANASSPILLNPQWHNIIQQLSYPSFISNDRCEVLAWNNAANELIIDFSSLADSERVMIRILFVDPELRLRMVNWEEFAMYSVAVFRTYYDKHLDDPWFAETVMALSEESLEFAAMWELYNIEHKKVNRVLFQLPDTIATAYDINSTSILSDNSDLHVCIYTPVLEEDNGLS